jgi:NAD(P)-dependent dehydrogenase (short-subunit alcohol dehydrogenase family)
MAGRLAGKTAVVVGAGQTPGETIGNGRATAILFGREGATVMCVDRLLERAEETAGIIASEGGQASAYGADITDEAQCEALIAEAKQRLGRIDILHNNVGIGLRDRSVTQLRAEDFDRIIDVNLKGMWLTIKHALPAMREQGGGGAITNISSMAAVASSNLVAYGMSKAGVNKLTRITAAGNTQYMIRCNCIMPGLMDTPMAVGGRATEQGRPTDDIRAQRDAQVPLGRKMGTAWDVAYAALFLASDEAKFITGAILPVDGGMSAGVG